MREVEGVTLYTIPEAAKVLGVTAQTVRRYIKEGVLKAQRVGRPYLISGESLKRFVTGGDTDPAPAPRKTGTFH
jgi:excisionase family DNA binding protein